MKSRRSIFKKTIYSISNNYTSYLVFKSISRNQHLELFYRYFSFYRYATKFSSSFHTKLKGVCFITGRSRGLVANFQLSRIVFKEYLTNGFLFGFKKSQWLVRLASLSHCLIWVYCNCSVVFW